jgi:hypothetical protein
MQNIKFGAGAVGIGAASHYGSGFTKMMRLRNIDHNSSHVIIIVVSCHHDNDLMLSRLFDSSFM